MMKRIVFMVTVALVMALMMAVAGPASATIHPIVESFDCANEQEFAHHPLGDPADPPGQTPGATPGNGQNVFRALSVVNEQAASTLVGGSAEHKLNFECGPPGGKK